jgi:hypothetical protein
LPVDLFQSLALHLQAARDQRSALHDESGGVSLRSARP